jgi:hypothetical protein
MQQFASEDQRVQAHPQWLNLCASVYLFHFSSVIHIIILPIIEHGRPDEVPNSQALQDKLSNRLICMCVMTCRNKLSRCYPHSFKSLPRSTSGLRPGQSASFFRIGQACHIPCSAHYVVANASNESMQSYKTTQCERGVVPDNG